MSKRQPTFLEERGRFMILDETTMAWADWEGIPKAPVGFLLSSPTSTTLSGSQQEPRRPGLRSRGASRSSTPARLATDPGTSANTSPGTSASALPSPPPLSPEAMAVCMKQFGAAYASLSQMRANLGGLGRSLGVSAPHPQHPQHNQQPYPLDFAGMGGGGEVGAGGGGMDPKPPQPDDKPVGGGNGNLNTSSSSNSSSSSSGNGAGTLPVSTSTSGALLATPSPASSSGLVASTSTTLLSTVGGGEGGLGGLGGAFGDVGGERSVKAELEATLAIKRKLVYELKAAKEESELLKKQNTILEQKLARLMTPTVSA